METKAEIQPHTLNRMTKKGDFSIWLKIKKEVIPTDRDMFMRTAYIPHQSPLIRTKTACQLLKMRSATTKHREMCWSVVTLTLEQAQNQTNIYLARSTSPLLHINTGTLTKLSTEMDTAAIMSHIESVHGQWSASRGILWSRHTQLSSGQRHSRLVLQTYSPHHPYLTLYIRKPPTDPHVTEPNSTIQTSL